MEHALKLLYYSTTQDAEDLGLGDAYQPPEIFNHGETTLVAKLQAEGDGHDVEVYECRLPATFFTIKALPRIDHNGKKCNGFSLSTGSSMAKIAGQIANSIANGMLSIT